MHDPSVCFFFCCLFLFQQFFSSRLKTVRHVSVLARVIRIRCKFEWKKTKALTGKHKKKYAKVKDYEVKTMRSSAPDIQRWNWEKNNGLRGNFQLVGNIVQFYNRSTLKQRMIE